MPCNLAGVPRTCQMLPGTVGAEAELAELPGDRAEAAAGAQEEEGCLACLVVIANKDGDSTGDSAVVESSKVTAVEKPEYETSLGEA